MSIIGKEDKPEEKIPILLDKLDDVIDFNLIYSPGIEPTPGDEPRIVVDVVDNVTIMVKKPGTEDKKLYPKVCPPQSKEALNYYIDLIKTKFKLPKWNFTTYKATQWKREMQISNAAAYGLSLLIPDIVRPPLFDLKIKEHPHLGIYLFGIPGGVRSTIGRILKHQWFYSFDLSETGFDSGIGVSWALSQANKDLILIGSDIGSATTGLKEWQRKLPTTIVNFIWDGRDTRTTKGEGTVRSINEGVSFFGGGNRALGKKAFTVRDVGRIIQIEMSSKKRRGAMLAARKSKSLTNLGMLSASFIRNVHYLNALIIQGRIKTGFFRGKTAVIDLSESLEKKITVFIFRNYMPNITENLSDDEIWEKVLELPAKLGDTEEDTNSILRIMTTTHMLVMDSAIDNLLVRPYTVEGNVIHIKATEADLIPFYAIMDKDFWAMKREEFEFIYKDKHKKETPRFLVPSNYYHHLLQTGIMLSAKMLYNKAKENLVDKKVIPISDFEIIYGKTNALESNAKLKTAIKNLSKMSDIYQTGKCPIMYVFRKSSI